MKRACEKVYSSKETINSKQDVFVGKKIYEHMKKVIFIAVLLVVFSGFKSLNRVDKIIAKEIKEVFEIENFNKEIVEIPIEVNSSLPVKISETNFYKLTANQEYIGYYYFGQAYGKADFFDFIVILNKDLIVSKVKIITYREDHGGEVGSKRWLKQFIGTDYNQELKYQKDIAAISGATISAKSMTNQVNRFLKTISMLHNKELL
ncbi:FMN-binding protein [Lutibacter citreus]|uniref:FMN-binding protein n=1 Tax=Lutibacter citreus TaxID=2138210 RepID=UPI000DBEA499|nr:FMN-binding protein [Lutibacter citreus]